MTRTRLALLGCLSLLVQVCAAEDVVVRYAPLYPSLHDRIRIEIHGCTQGGTLHWGVNAVGGQWEEAIPEYRPAGSVMEGKATRTELEGPDSNGVCRIALGPFDNTNQLIRALNFALQWKDGTWSNKDEKNFNVPVSFGRITVEPERPTINDRIVVKVHRSGPGGQLRWGVNAENDLWLPPSKLYWPDGTVPARDGLAVDTPISRPDASNVSTVVLGPFRRAEQVVRTLHMAVHWGDVWDTDASRNYNVEITFDHGTNAPHVEIRSPADGEVVVDAPQVQLQADRAERVEMWLNGKSIATVSETPFELKVPFQQLKYGRHQLTARAQGGDQVDLQEIYFWKLPPHRLEAIPPGTPWGATDHGDGTVTFALHAPGKRFVSVVGDFNGWDRFGDMMNASPDGTWWIRRPVSNGVWQYQYLVEGRQFLADPYARDVSWKDERGVEGYQPWDARAVVRVGQPAFTWTATNYVRPPLENLIVYEFHIDDLCPGQGFTGVIAKLDYIKGLGCNALGPMPWTEFAMDHSWGYNPSFHFAPESSYGTPDDLKRLIDEAHRRGLAVIMDAVFNHMDRNSALYQLYGRDYEGSPYFRLFQGENWGFPDLEQTSRAVKRYMADCITMWLQEYRVDGIRYDATRFVEWQGYNDWGASWFAYAGKQADSNSYMIAEHMPSDPDFINQTEMDTTWHDYFRWGLRGMVEEARLDRDEFERILDPRRIGFTNAFQRMAYTESHDEERVMRELKRRGFPEAEARRRAEMALALTLTAPGAAMIYAGQEFGEDTPKVVGANPLNWKRTEGWWGRGARDLRGAAQALLQLRANHPALRTGDITVLRDGLPADVAVYTRSTGEAGVVVAANFGRRSQRVAVPLPHGGAWRNVVSQEEFRPGRDGRASMLLAPGQALVLSHDGEAPAENQEMSEMATPPLATAL
jgi:1,4-alpha-glucan branching enzyme